MNKIKRVEELLTKQKDLKRFISQSFILGDIEYMNFEGTNKRYLYANDLGFLEKTVTISDPIIAQAFFDTVVELKQKELKKVEDELNSLICG